MNEAGVIASDALAPVLARASARQAEVAALLARSDATQAEMVAAAERLLAGYRRDGAVIRRWLRALAGATEDDITPSLDGLVWLEGIDLILARIETGVAAERKAMDALLARLTRPRPPSDSPLRE